MATRSTSRPRQPTKVPRIPPVAHHLYLAPGASELQACACDADGSADLPACPAECVRVVCVSDTHNEHRGLVLPPGDVLLHTGDVLTESGIRRSAKSKASGSDDEGTALLEGFAEWFGEQRFAHKVLIGGNHDTTLELLGKERVQEILSERCTFGEVVYLQGGTATLGRLRMYGSPYAAYSSHNNAFHRANPSYKVPKGVHVVATHMPAVLPGGSRKNLKQHLEITEPSLDAGALLHVSGHCHWANGLYFARRSTLGAAWPSPESEVTPKEHRLPCVVASVCSGSWLGGAQLKSSTGARGDPRDAHFGGYNLTQPGMVCDVLVGEAHSVPPVTEPILPEVEAQPTAPAPPSAAGAAPSLLFFCPPTDAALAELLLPQLRAMFDVVHVETAADGVAAVAERRFAVCLAKLGHKGNLGRDIIAALRSAQGAGPQVIVHSSTAQGNPRLQETWRDEFGVDFFTCHGHEEELLQRLSALPSSLPRVLVFGPPNDPAFLDAFLPLLPSTAVEVDVVHSAEDGARAARERPYSACVVKLGTRGNLGVDVLAALRAREAGGPAAWAAVHSATAAGKPETRARFETEHGVQFFAQHGEEAALAEALLRAVTG